MEHMVVFQIQEVPFSGKLDLDLEFSVCVENAEKWTQLGFSCKWF